MHMYVSIGREKRERVQASERASEREREESCDECVKRHRFDVNSTQEKPKYVSDSYLGMLLSQMKQAAILNSQHSASLQVQRKVNVLEL